MKSKLWRVLESLILTSVLAVTALAQSIGGTLTGTVTDPSGGVIANAAVTATNSATGRSANSVSTSSGNYRLPELPVGVYQVTVSAPGFGTATRTAVAVQLGTTSSLDISLSVGEATTTVNVEASSPQLQMDSSDVGTVVTPRQVVDLPLSIAGSAMRNAAAFVVLTPATYGTGTAGGASEVGIGGGQTMASEVLYDGSSIQTQSFGDWFELNSLPSVEAIGEFKVMISGAPAQYGRTSSGVQIYATKAGTNQWHGGVFDLFHNTALDANTWFNNLSIARNGRSAQNRTPSDMKNEYGVLLGGPILIPHIYDGRNKSFFFFSWGQYRQNAGYSNLETIPTPANLRGDFSANLTTQALGTNPCDGTTIYAGQVFDPTTTKTLPSGEQCRTAYKGNIVNTPLSPVAKAVATFIPAPSSTALTNNYISAGSRPILDTAYTIRIDHAFGDNDKIYGTYNYRDDITTYTQSFLWLPVSPYITRQNIPVHLFRVGYDHIFSPHLLNHATLGLTRILDAQNYLTVDAGKDWSAAIGLPGGSGPLFPGFATNEGSTVAFGNPQANPGYNGAIGDFVGNVADNVVWTKGRHNLSIGGEYRYMLSTSSFISPTAGSFQFGRLQTAANIATASGSGNGVASFLLGQVASVASTRNLVSLRNIGHYLAGYVQDEFKVNPNLNLSLGLRYDIDIPFREAHDFASSFSPTALNTGAQGTGIAGALIFAGSGGGRSNVSSRWQETYYKNIEPRLGFSWSPSWLNQKTTVLGNYSIMNAPLLAWGLEYSGIPSGFASNVTVNNIANTFGAAELLDPGSPVTPGIVFPGSYGTPATSQSYNFDPSQLNNQQIPWGQKRFGRPGFNQLWGLSVQQQFATDLIFTLGYLGQVGTHLGSNLLFVNDLNPKYFSIGAHLNDIVSAGTPSAGVSAPYPGFKGTVAQALRPYPQYTYVNTAAYGENEGHMSSNMLTAKLERRFHNGLNVLASYTWTKIISDTGGAEAGNLGGAYVPTIQNPFDLRSEKAVAKENVPHLFVLSYIYDLPFGKNRHFLHTGNALNAVVGGWSFTGIQRYQSGQPVAFGCATSVPGMAITQQGTNHCIRWNLVPGQAIHSAARDSGSFNPAVAGQNTWYNPAAFSDPNANVTLASGLPYRFGNKPAFQSNDSSFAYLNEDFGLTKRTAITESVTMVFRTEMFNAFNRHIFGTPINNPYTAGFGTVSSLANTPRAVQFTLRFDF
jgi:hypothetical protein